MTYTLKEASKILKISPQALKRRMKSRNIYGNTMKYPQVISEDDLEKLYIANVKGVVVERIQKHQ